MNGETQHRVTLVAIFAVFVLIIPPSKLPVTTTVS